MAPSLVNEDNLSAVLHKKGDLRLENRPVPEPKDDEVLIRMAVVGICGTDVSFWTKGKVGDFVVKEPMVLGHESSGTVIKVGQKVKHLQPGDRVAIEPGGQCLYCEHCKSGRYNLCRKMEFCTTTPSHGNLCRYYTHAADFCFKLPDHVSLEEGALCEPLSIGLQACRRAQVSLGHTVLVCGAGAMGIVNLIVARAMGASKILMTDISASRLEAAKELGADQVLLVEAGVEMSQYATEVATLLGGAPDISIECSGAESSIKLAILATKSGGTVALVGLGPAEVKIPIVNAATREVDIRGVWRCANCYPTVLAMIASGSVDVSKMVTHRYALQDTLLAYERARTGADGAIKILINCD